MKTGLKAICERTASVLKEIRALQSVEELSDENLERLAFLRTELRELCPPERYAWVDGLPVIDIAAELVKIENERRRLHMEAIEVRKKLISDAIMKKLESTGKNAIAEFEAAKAEVLRLQESLPKYRARETSLEEEFRIEKEKARQKFESGKDVGSSRTKMAELQAELDVVRESIEETEDDRLPAARQAMEASERALKQIVGSVAAEYRVEIKEEFDRHVAELEILLAAWQFAGFILGSALKVQGQIHMPPLRFSSGILYRNYIPGSY